MGLRRTPLEEQDGTIRKLTESTQPCVPNPFTQTSNNNRLLRGLPDVRSDDPYFPIYFEIYEVVLSLLEKQGSLSPCLQVRKEKPRETKIQFSCSCWPT